MISLGVVDLGVSAIFLIAAYVLLKERLFGFFYMIAFIYVILLVERVAPGALAQVSQAIQSVNRLNDTMPHLNINPVVTFK